MVVSRGEAWVCFERRKAIAVPVVLLLEVTGCIVVAVYGADGSRSRMCKVALIVRVTQGTRLGVALLTEAGLIWGGQFGATWIDASIGTVLFSLFAARVEASIVFRAVRARARHRTVWLTDGVKIALLTKLLEAVVRKLAVDVDVGFGGKTMVLAYLVGRRPAFGWAYIARLWAGRRAMVAAQDCWIYAIGVLKARASCSRRLGIDFLQMVRLAFRACHRRQGKHRIRDPEKVVLAKG